MRLYIKSTISNPIHRRRLFSPLLTVVVATLISGTILQANAELIMHSDSSESTPKKHIVKPVANATNSSVSYQNISKQAPTDMSIIKLMQVMHIDEQIKSIVNGQQAAIDAINRQTQNNNQQASDKPLNKRQLELQNQIQSILGQYAKIMSQGIGDATDAQTLTQAYINAAKTHYTQAEVDAQIEFYDTRMGQSILAKQPQITADFLKQSLPDETSATEAQLGELLPQMKQIMKNIF